MYSSIASKLIHALQHPSKESISVPRSTLPFANLFLGGGVCVCVAGVRRRRRGLGQKRERRPGIVPVVPQRHDHHVGDHGREGESNDPSGGQDSGATLACVSCEIRASVV